MKNHLLTIVSLVVFVLVGWLAWIGVGMITFDLVVDVFILVAYGVAILFWVVLVGGLYGFVLEWWEGRNSEW